MTAGRDALRERLAERLIPFVWSTGDVDAVIREIAPVIEDDRERFAAEQVAAALNSAADEEDAKAVAVGIRLDRCIPPGNWLRARAAAVLAANDNDRRQG